MSGYDERCRADARLAILAELARQSDATLSSRSLAPFIEQVVPRRPSEWLDAQLQWLAQMGAINITRSSIAGLGDVIIATLTVMGRNHVERRAPIPGVSMPADER